MKPSLKLGMIVLFLDPIYGQPTEGEITDIYDPSIDGDEIVYDISYYADHDEWKRFHNYGSVGSTPNIPMIVRYYESELLLSTDLRIAVHNAKLVSR